MYQSQSHKGVLTINIEPCLMIKLIIINKLTLSIAAKLKDLEVLLRRGWHTHYCTTLTDK